MIENNLIEQNGPNRKKYAMKKRKINLNVIKLRNDGFEENTKNVLPFFLENLNFFVDIQVEMCGLLSFLIIGQLFIGICFWRYL